MKILFIKPYSKVLYKSSISPDSGLAYLITSLRKNGFTNIAVLDLSNNNLKLKNFVDFIEHHKPNIIGFKMFSTDCYDVSSLSMVIKKLHPDIFTVAGGPHPTLANTDFLQNFPSIDFAFLGEAELGLPYLVKEIARNNLLKDSLIKIPSLIWRDNNEIIQNKINRIDKLDDAGFPSWDMMKISSYIKNAGIRGLFMPILFTRGCPFSCSFCGAPIINGHKLRYHSHEYILEEIKTLIKKYNIHSLMISDDNPTINKQYFLELLDRIINSTLKIKFYSYNGLRVDTLDKDMLIKMERAGFQNIVMSIESASPKILKKMNKKLDLSIIYEKAFLVRKFTKMTLQAYFILGYPDETENDLNKTSRLARNLPLHLADFSLFSPHPGTPIFNELKNSGKLKNIDFNSFDYQQVSIDTGYIGKKRLKKLQLRTYLLFYLRYKIIIRMLREMKNIRFIKSVFRKIYILLGNFTPMIKYEDIKRIQNPM